MSGVNEVYKKSPLLSKRLCAHDWSRTSTSLRTLPPQGSVSTNSTTWAETEAKINKIDEKKHAIYIFASIWKKSKNTNLGI